MIETRGLTKYYGRTRGIDALDLSVKAGEFFGFIGPNGAGKSTTIRTLLGLLRPTRGGATVFGLDVTSRGTEIRRRLGYIPAEVGFYGGMTGEAMLRFASRMHGVEPAWGREVAARMDLDLQRKADELSTGNRKKLAIVLALQHRPELVILDEPSAGLDPLMQGVLFDLLREEHGRGATVFFSSHVLDEVQRMCRRVAIVRNGRIVEVAEIETLRQRHLKRVRAVFPGDPPAQALAIEGVTNLAVEDDSARFDFTGPPRALLALLAKRRVVDVTIEDPTLDDVFLHYYGSDTEDGDAEEAPS
jgi:ABC-2 type transport system ATP-binding protein